MTFTDNEYREAIQLCRDVVDAVNSDDGGPTVAGSFLGKLRNLLNDSSGRDTDTAISVEEARERVLTAALRVLQAERSSGHADSGAETEYADDQLALAARDLTEATGLADSKPVGWSQ